MSSYAQAANCEVTLVDTFERTSLRASRIPSLRRLSENLKKSTDSSEFLSRVSLFEKRNREIDALAFTEDNWNSYGSPAPSADAIKLAKDALCLLRNHSILPTKVLPSAEGGVAMTFHSSTRNRAVLETLNNGEAFILIYDLDGNNQTLDWKSPTATQLQHVEMLGKHLRS